MIYCFETGNPISLPHENNLIMNASKRMICFVFVGLTNLIYAQNKLSGTVVSGIDGKPVEGALIYIPEIYKSASTDANGNFVLRHITKDTVTLTCDAAGYDTYIRKIVFDRPEKHVKIALKEKVYCLDKVVVSLPFGQMQKDNVTKVEVKKADELKKLGITELSEGLGHIPGVRILSGSSATAKPVVRGLTGSRLMIYNQNMPYDNFQFGAKHGLGLEMEGVEAVEVIKGPSSFIYGSGALGGVIYIVPEAFAPKKEVKAEAYGYFRSISNGFKYGAAFKKSGEKLKFLARYTSNRNDDYRTPDGLYVKNSARVSDDIKLGISYDENKRKWVLRYQFHGEKNALYAGFSQENPQDFMLPYQNTRQHTVNLENNWKINRKNKLHLSSGFSSHNRSLIKNNAPFIGMVLKTLTFDARWKHKKEQWQFIQGVQLSDKTVNNYGQHYLLPDARQLTGGIYFTFITETPSADTWQAGIRWDLGRVQTGKDSIRSFALDKTLKDFSFSGGWKKQTEFTNLRLTLSKGFRAPNLAELTSDGVHAGRIEKGNANLKNETNWQGDFNFEFKTIHFEWFVNMFYNRIYNYIYLAPTGQMQNNLSVYAYKQSDAYLYGGETGFHFHPHFLHNIHLSVSYETVTGKKSSGQYLPLMPPDRVVGRLQFLPQRENTDSWDYRAGLEWNYILPAYRLADNEIYRPDYHLVHLNAYVSKKFNRYKAGMYFRLRNVLNTYVVPHLSAWRDKNIPEPGRSFEFGIRISF
jgi:iron complex outermembrane receptor protein